MNALSPLPPTFADTREVLRSVACFVVAPARKALTGRISLRPTGDGFGTPRFDDGRRFVVRGAHLVIEDDDAPAERAPLTTLRDAAALLGIELSPDPGVGHDLPPYRPDEPLDVDEGASLALGQWYAFGSAALQRFRAGHGADVGEAQLWPEHFDLGAVVTLDGGAAVNLGFSPGDGWSPEPYTYVGPHDTAGLGGTYWNAPFGAAATYSHLAGQPNAVEAIDDFLREGLRLAADR